MAFSGLRKMLTLINSNTLWCMSVGVSCNFMGTVVNGSHIKMAHVITIVLYRQILCLTLWQMLLPISDVVYVVDGRQLGQMS